MFPAHPLALFFGGAFLANAIPHLVKGICGDPFPTPFAKPPGKGLSSAPVNILWALFNLIAGTVLFRIGHVWNSGNLALILFFAGVAFISIMLSFHFQNKHPE